MIVKSFFHVNMLLLEFRLNNAKQPSAAELIGNLLKV